MFEIGFPELVLIAIVGLLVIGPERLPEALRTLGLWFGRMRRSFTTVKAEIEKEIGMDEVKRQLHNEAIMEEMKRIEAEVKNTADTARSSINEGVQAAEMPKIDPGSLAGMDATIAAQDGPDPAVDAPPDASDNAAVKGSTPDTEPGEAAGAAAQEDEQKHPQPPTRAGDPVANADPAQTAGTDTEQASRG